MLLDQRQSEGSWVLFQHRPVIKQFGVGEAGSWQDGEDQVREKWWR